MKVNINRGNYEAVFEQIDRGDIVMYDGIAVIKTGCQSVIDLDEGREFYIADHEMVTVPRDVEVNITL